MQTKKDKQRVHVVYSTNPNFSYEYEQSEEQETLEAKHQDLRVCLDKKQRAGKAVTLVTGFVGKKEDLEVLGKLLKTKCGVGGSVKDNQILLQGDFCTKTLEILHSLGYKAKRSGG